ncbi:GFA family protein [Sphingopyxis sp. H115]|uniref:GFA family protein n=1 Tax=Sphingopyxis sp. H115 TaxID=1759073 RepID=UPI000736F617|nr:GFA family protein [Sphingopyxis sp. H115]KTE10727.1 aldehyde-activating protein [Sphingopyxis sp. H115]
MERRATCHCGQLLLRCTGEPSKVSLCHCFDCQRRTGSLFSVAAFFPRECVTVIAGTAKVFARASASGFDVAFHFCPECGSSLWWEPARMPHLAGVAAGAFEDSGFPVPEQAVWAEQRHTWLDLPLTEYARNPVKAPLKDADPD